MCEFHVLIYLQDLTEHDFRNQDMIVFTLIFGENKISTKAHKNCHQVVRIRVHIHNLTSFVLRNVRLSEDCS